MSLNTTHICFLCVFVYSCYIDTPPVSFGPNKQARGQQDSMERGKERVGKQTLLSSSSPAGFRSSQHTLGPLTDPLTPPLSNAEELDSSSSDSSTVRSRTELKKIPAHGASTSAASKETSMNKETTLSQQKRRYIAFIGNLPFTATGDDVIEQFEKKGLHISQVRLLTDRASGSSKGCCFAEFPNAKTLQASSLMSVLSYYYTI